jgi:hypothetical protein
MSAAGIPMVRGSLYLIGLPEAELGSFPATAARNNDRNAIGHSCRQKGIHQVSPPELRRFFF